MPSKTALAGIRKTSTYPTPRRETINRTESLKTVYSLARNNTATGSIFSRPLHAR